MRVHQDYMYSVLILSKRSAGVVSKPKVVYQWDCCTWVLLIMAAAGVPAVFEVHVLLKHTTQNSSALCRLSRP